MKPQLNIITLGVKDFKRSENFYIKGLGWKKSSDSNNNIIFIQLNSIILALYNHESLAEDANIVSDRSNFRGFTLAYCTKSEAEVQEVLQTAEKAGAKIVKKAQKVFWGGYSGYFSDPDGFLWEVAYNPYLKMDDAGNAFLSE